MSRSSKASSRRQDKPVKSTAQPAPPSTENQPDKWAAFLSKFDRFGWDAIGVIFLAAAVVLLLALTGLTQGVFISPWVLLLRRYLGWGSLVACFVLGLFGLLALRRHIPGFPAINLSRIIVLEGWVFALLTLLAITGGTSLDRAEGGLDGGIIGWGLAELIQTHLPPLWGTVLVAVLLVLFTFIGFGVFPIILFVLEKIVAESEKRAAIQEALQSQTSVESEAPVEKARSTPAARPEKLDRPRFAEKGAGSTKPAVPIKRDERLPPLNLLMQEQTVSPDEESIKNNASLIEKTLSEFGVPARVAGFRMGPTVTQYAVEPGFVEKVGPDGEVQHQKVRVSQISALARDLALALSAERLRIEAPVPGQSFVGIEVPNQHNTIVRLRPLLETDSFQKLGALAIVLGRDVSGHPVVADLVRMPHMLIAGTTGSGKSVCIAAIAVSLVMNNTPSELRLAMLDPKMVELVRFNGLPHLMGRVETKTERMLGVLNWAIAEMDRRYRLLEESRARDLDNYNKKMSRHKLETLPRIVIIIDELADLMMTAPDQTEHSLVRLAQLARATGIHLIVATQRPSTDVVTGLIKANFPARISFTVASSIDSRVILDTNGAETLLGRGDMLFLNPEQGTPIRSQGVMVTDQEIEGVIQYWQKMSPGEKAPPPWENMIDQNADSSDELVQQAIEIVKGGQHASASLLQRRLRIGYPRAARLIDELEGLGIVGPAQPGGREREVLVSRDEDDEGEEEDKDLDE
ncbi:MAG: DNA translocase FtsK [Anaerolineaceae bacterium]|nr:DNA translocase FtsK [Anaerolineaceae bacterium]